MSLRHFELYFWVATWIKQFNEGRICIELNLQPLVSNCREPIYSSIPALPFFLRHNYCFFCFAFSLLLIPFFSEEFALHYPWKRDIVPCDTRKPHMALLNCDHLWRLPICTIPTALWSSPLSDLSLFAEVLILLNSWPICLNFRWFSPCEEPRRK